MLLTSILIPPPPPFVPHLCRPEPDGHENHVPTDGDRVTHRRIATEINAFPLSPAITPLQPLAQPNPSCTFSSHVVCFCSPCLLRL